VTFKTHCQYCALSVINGIPCHESGCHRPTIFVSRGRQYRKFSVWALDVWGNAKEGFEVNDRSQISAIMVPADFSDTQLLRALKRAGLLRSKTRFSSFSVDGDEDSLFIDAAKTGEPLYQLEAA
jgi:hypothetical protein